MGDHGVTYRQLRNLVDAVSHHNVIVQIIPLSSGLHSGLSGGFLVMEFGDEPGLLYTENRGCGAFLEQREHLVSGRKSFRQLCAMALPCAASTDLIASIGDEILKTEQELPEAGPASLPCSLTDEPSQPSYLAEPR